MRKFVRSEPPLIWRQNESRWNEQWMQLIQTKPQASFSWYIHEGITAREIALPYLKHQTAEHCSFCDGFPVDSVSPDTIEHFRPKSVSHFPEHAYSWENLYYCCSSCQTHKGQKWDDELIAPDEDDYRFERYFEFDFTTGTIRPSITANDADKIRASATITIYGLDTSNRQRWRLLAQRQWSKIPLAARLLDDFPYRDFLNPA